MNEIYRALWQEIKAMETGIVAIDGRCGSGKTGLAAFLETELNCAVIHMDDFYLPMGERKENWQQIPGGNMDFARLIREVLEPLIRGEAVTVRPYDCGKAAYGAEREIVPGKLTVIEGSYSHHPLLRQYYDKMIFLTCDKEIQKQRLLAREGEKYAMFEKLWIPMEERYLSAFPTPEEAIFLDTGGLF